MFISVSKHSYKILIFHILILYLTHSFNLCVLNSSVSHFSKQKAKKKKKQIYYSHSVKWKYLLPYLGFPGGPDDKESPCNAGDLGSIPGLGRSPGEGKGYPLQYSCLDNPHGQRILAGYSPWGYKKLGHDWATRHTVAAISINNKCHSHQQFLASKCEWGLPKLWSSRCHHPPRWLLKRLSNARSSHLPLLKGNKEIGFGHR